MPNLSDSFTLTVTEMAVIRDLAVQGHICDEEQEFGPLCEDNNKAQQFIGGINDFKTVIRGVIGKFESSPAYRKMIESRNALQALKDAFDNSETFTNEEYERLTRMTQFVQDNSDSLATSSDFLERTQVMFETYKRRRAEFFAKNSPTTH